MLRKMNKNSGMSLIEVIVSMLVLSIAVVAVTMSFSTASRMNVGSSQKQSTGSLMENLMEYAESGGTNYKDWFFVSAADYDSETDDEDSDKFIETLNNVTQGIHKYDVKIITDSSPEEYATTKLNEFDVIKFGGANSGTIMIDASLNSSTSSYGTNTISTHDKLAYEHFYDQHCSAVVESNLAGAVPPLTETALEDIPNFVDRELRVEVSQPTSDKLQVTAYFIYSLDSSIVLPDSVSHEFTGQLLVESKLYDVPSSTDTNAKKLTQIYIMYSKAELEPENIGFNQDIRIMDPNNVMKADIFIAKQQESSSVVDNVLDKNLGTGRDTTMYNVRVSFRKPQEGTVEYCNPAGGNIYCSGVVELQDFTVFEEHTKCYSKNLAAKGKDVRIITTTLEIYKAGTDTLLASKTVTHLQ